MIEDVEKLRPQLQIHPLEELRVLADRKIYIPEMRPIDFVSSKIAERSKRRIRERIARSDTRSCPAPTPSWS